MDEAMLTTTTAGKRSRDETTEGSPAAAKRLHAEILDILEDVSEGPSDDGGDLASVMWSLEEEISLPCPPRPVTSVEEEPGSSRQPELGYLLEASDDELGLPPTTTLPSTSGELEVAVEDEPETDEGGCRWTPGGDGAGCYDAFDLIFDGAADAGGFLLPGSYFEED